MLLQKYWNFLNIENTIAGGVARKPLYFNKKILFCPAIGGLGTLGPLVYASDCSL